VRDLRGDSAQPHGSQVPGPHLAERGRDRFVTSFALVPVEHRGSANDTGDYACEGT